jgi:hypothetical protein
VVEIPACLESLFPDNSDIRGGPGGLAFACPSRRVQMVHWVCALMAGFFAAIYKALDFDVSLKVVAQHAHELKILQDTGTISSLRSD